MSEIQQKSFSIYFFVRPQPYLDPKMEHFKRIYGYPAIWSFGVFLVQYDY